MKLHHSLINSTQIHAYGIDVFDNLFDIEMDFGISHPDEFIPFEVDGSTIFLSFTSTDEQLNTC